jgi:ketosteroid isomerase-like protein
VNSETTLAATSEVEADIRNVLNSWQKAASTCNLDKIMTFYAPDILSFDAVCQLQFKGIAAYRAHWQACMEMCKGEMIFEIHEVKITASDDIAFGHYLTRCGSAAEGSEKASWMRGTVCLRRINVNWKIVHEHFSSPFDPATGKALFDLKP